MIPLFTIPIKADDPDNVDQLLSSKQPEVSAYEIWLDAMPRSLQTFPLVEKNCLHWRSLTKKKLIFVCKNPTEQGKFTGTDHAKVELLLAAAKGGADFVDIGLHTKKTEIQRLRDGLKKTKLIISHHDFKKTPSETKLRNLVRKMQKLGADVCKIATFVNDLEDNRKLIELTQELKKRKVKHIIIGMGEKGMITRILSKELGNELQFVSLETVTAPGQLTLKQVLGFRFLGS